MEKEDLIIFLQQEMNGSLPENRKAELDAFIADESNKEMIIDAYVQLMDTHPSHPRYTVDYFAPILQSILTSDKSTLHSLPSITHTYTETDHSAPSIVRPMRKRWIPYAAAAAGIALLTAIGFLWLKRTPAPAELAKNDTIPVSRPIAPGKNGAVLTLADGSQVVLDSLGNGLITTQGNTNVSLQDGAVTYQRNTAAAGEIIYNTMSTPKGRQFRLILPDGSKVWLNAASSLRYPTSFSGKERRVDVTDEAYFEVAHNTAMPFHVNINEHSSVEVLGTHFNVNAYADESAVRTTLLTGSVKVNSDAAYRVLSPGQQSRSRREGSDITVIKEADVDQAVAWKNGIFSFNDADLPTVMRSLARWYDVEIEYAGAIPGGTFNGEIGKDLTLDQVLKGLTHTKIRYRIEKGNKIIILP